MANNKTKPTAISVNTYLRSVSEKRKSEAKAIIDIMQGVSGQPPVMWGPSIIGFGTRHYKYASGREGDIPRIGFSPRKASLTVYFYEGFGEYQDQLKVLGKYKSSVSCLYINKLIDIDLDILSQMVSSSYKKKF